MGNCSECFSESEEQIFKMLIDDVYPKQDTGENDDDEDEQRRQQQRLGMRRSGDDGDDGGTDGDDDGSVSHDRSGGLSAAPSFPASSSAASDAVDGGRKKRQPGTFLERVGSFDLDEHEQQQQQQQNNGSQQHSASTTPTHQQQQEQKQKRRSAAVSSKVRSSMRSDINLNALARLVEYVREDPRKRVERVCRRVLRILAADLGEGDQQEDRNAAAAAAAMAAATNGGASSAPASAGMLSTKNNTGASATSPPVTATTTTIDIKKDKGAIFRATVTRTGVTVTSAQGMTQADVEEANKVNVDVQRLLERKPKSGSADVAPQRRAPPPPPPPSAEPQPSTPVSAAKANNNNNNIIITSRLATPAAVAGSSLSLYSASLPPPFSAAPQRAATSAAPSRDPRLQRSNARPPTANDPSTLWPSTAANSASARAAAPGSSSAGSSSSYTGTPITTAEPQRASSPRSIARDILASLDAAASNVVASITNKGAPSASAAAATAGPLAATLAAEKQQQGVENATAEHKKVAAVASIERRGWKRSKSAGSQKNIASLSPFFALRDKVAKVVDPLQCNSNNSSSTSRDPSAADDIGLAEYYLSEEQEEERRRRQQQLQLQASQNSSSIAQGGATPQQASASRPSVQRSAMISNVSPISNQSSATPLEASTNSNSIVAIGNTSRDHRHYQSVSFESFISEGDGDEGQAQQHQLQPQKPVSPTSLSGRAKSPPQPPPPQQQRQPRTTRFLLASPTQRSIGAVNPSFFYQASARQYTSGGGNNSNGTSSSSRHIRFDRIIASTDILRALIEEVGASPEAIGFFVPSTQAACELLLLERGETSLKIAGAQLLSVLARQLWATMRRAQFGNYHERARLELAGRVDFVQALQSMAVHGVGQPDIDALHGRYTAIIAIAELSTCLGSWMPETKPTLFALLHVLSRWFRGPPEPDLKSALSDNGGACGLGFGSGSSGRHRGVMRIADRAREQLLLRDTLRASCDQTQLMSDPPPIRALALGVLRDWHQLRAFLHALTSVAAGTTADDVAGVADAVVDFLTENRLWWWWHGADEQGGVGHHHHHHHHHHDQQQQQITSAISASPQHNKEQQQRHSRHHQRTLSDAFSASEIAAPAASHFSWVVTRCTALAVQTAHGSEAGLVFLYRVLAKLVAGTRHDSSIQMNIRRATASATNSSFSSMQQQQQQQQSPSLCIFERIGLLECLSEIVSVAVSITGAAVARDIAEACVRSLHTGKLPPRVPPRPPTPKAAVCAAASNTGRAISFMDYELLQGRQQHTPRESSVRTLPPTSAEKPKQRPLDLPDEHEQHEDAEKKKQQQQQQQQQQEEQHAAVAAAAIRESDEVEMADPVVHNDGELGFLRVREQHAAVEVITLLAARSARESNWMALSTIASVVLTELRRLFFEQDEAATLSASSSDHAYEATPAESTPQSAATHHHLHHHAANRHRQSAAEKEKAFFVPISPGCRPCTSTHALWAVLLRIAPLLRHLPDLERHRLQFIRRVALFYSIEPIAPRCIALYLVGVFNNSNNHRPVAVSSALSSSSSSSFAARGGSNNNNHDPVQPPTLSFEDFFSPAAEGREGRRAIERGILLRSDVYSCCKSPLAISALCDLFKAFVAVCSWDNGGVRVAFDFIFNRVQAQCEHEEAEQREHGQEEAMVKVTELTVAWTFAALACLHAVGDVLLASSTSDNKLAFYARDLALRRQRIDDSVAEQLAKSAQQSGSATAGRGGDQEQEENDDDDDGEDEDDDGGDSADANTKKTLQRKARNDDDDEDDEDGDGAAKNEGSAKKRSKQNRNREREAELVDAMIHSAPLVPSCFLAPHLLPSLSSSSSSRQHRKQQQLPPPLPLSSAGLIVVSQDGSEISFDGGSGEGGDEALLDDIKYVAFVPEKINRETTAVYVLKSAANKAALEAVVADLDENQRRKDTKKEKRRRAAENSSGGGDNGAAAAVAAAAASASGTAASANRNDAEDSSTDEEGDENGDDEQEQEDKEKRQEEYDDTDRALMILSPSVGHVLAQDDARIVAKLCSF